MANSTQFSETRKHTNFIFPTQLVNTFLRLGTPYSLFLQDPPTTSSKGSFASTDVTGQCKPGSGGASRMTKLTEEQKEDISNMASPACMEAAERKRQYAAMGRAIVKSCNPSLLAKYQLCSDTERCGVGHKSHHIYLIPIKDF